MGTDDTTDSTDVTLDDGTKLGLRKATDEEATGKPKWELFTDEAGKTTLRRLN